jgi:hypothetical protein
MELDPDKVGDLCSSLVMIAFAVVLVALLLASGAWLLERVWPW